MPDAPKCSLCNASLPVGALFCPKCGVCTGRADWSLGVEGQGPGEPVRIRPGERFVVVARNGGASPVRVNLNVRGVRGASLVTAASASVSPGASTVFEFQHDASAPLGGVVEARSEDGPRERWHDRRSWRTARLALSGVTVRSEHWRLGSPTVVFPSGVRRQYVRVWNDSDRERLLAPETPAGYRVLCFGADIAAAPPAVGAMNSQELTVETLPVGPYGAADVLWTALPELPAAPLVRLTQGVRRPQAVAVVAVDFGTRNTRMCVRWRHTVVPAKPAGTEDVVLDVPAAMVLDPNERSFHWGQEAARRIDQHLLGPTDVAVTNLKTHLRDGSDGFAHVRKEWTNGELLARYFDRIVARLDEYLLGADAATPLSRQGMPMRYVLTRPVLDFNEGDEGGRAYERALLEALTRAGVPGEDVVFVLEPVAAAIGIAANRREELLGLPEGAAVAVVDAGGGTTDISLARVRLAGGKVSLDVTGSFDLRLGDANPALPALERFGLADRQFGGNTLDCALADRLLTAADQVLESDVGEPPTKLQVEAPDRFPIDCRKMKEGFAWSSRQYLYRRPAGQPGPPAPEAFPFANRPQYEGVHLPQQLYDERVQAPIVHPLVDNLMDRAAAGDADAVRPQQVRRVFYVGGTNIDPSIRPRFGRAFLQAPPDHGAQERIAERLGAVVRGAVWFDEEMLMRSPLSLTLRMPAGDRTVVSEGDVLKPHGQATPAVVPLTLAPWEELDAGLYASGGGLSEPAHVAQAFWRNESDAEASVTLRVLVSADRGVTASLVAGLRTVEEWRFVLVEARR